jgi:hypothetical protein
LPEALLYVLLYFAMMIATAIYIYTTTTPYDRVGVHARILTLVLFWPVLLTVLAGMFIADMVRRVKR